MRLINGLAFNIAKLAAHIPRYGLRIARFAGKVFPDLRCYPVNTRYGIIYCDLRESVCLPLLSYSEYPHWRADEEAIARIPLTSDSVVLDVGANIGVTVRLFAARAGHVHAFEPAPRAMPLLEANTADLKNVTIHAYALSNKDEIVCFEEKPGLDFSSLSSEGIQVPAKTIDSLGLAPDFIKIDVEGYEHRVLEGARQTIKDGRPVILFEALNEAARQYCENIIREANPNYRFESIGKGLNHIAWPTAR